ncbi:MAG: hypothetical protein BIP78_0731 [Candidatus Bipolaricaulis sibiricus]|uniref:Uncharacterized protein n=1 Tax=Bipolaricaulis sibiricus TaxID=2501609 RepID=A0A410FTS3_BIPS1|nr:MAG: hypothetical protein BIP78_0731 [Candidatus Bipolaricaulis sibiricus]
MIASSWPFPRETGRRARRAICRWVSIVEVLNLDAIPHHSSGPAAREWIVPRQGGISGQGGPACPRCQKA